MINVLQKRIQASELYGDFWFNSGPVSIRALHGSTILINFWDFSSASCIRSLLYLNEWFRKYRDFGLMVIGVHTPEFKFGKNPEHLQRAILTASIKYPVVSDNEGIIWNSFGSVSRPTNYLIDKDGFIRYIHGGEGGYDQLERTLQSLLVEAGFHGELPPLVEPLRAMDAAGALCFKASGEIQLGYLRGTIGNVEGYNPEATLQYDDPQLYLPSRFYAQGKWFGDKEYIRFDGLRGEEGYIAFGYEAVEVNAVMNPIDSRKSRVRVFQDSLPLTRENRGEDVVIDEAGSSYVLVDTPRLFNVVKNKEYGDHILKLVANSPSVALYSFSFVTGVIPDLISRN